MNGKQIVDRCSSIVKRQDFDRVLALGFINDMRKNLIRSTYVKATETIKDLPYNSYGEISLRDNGVKLIKSIEYYNPDGSRRELVKIIDYRKAQQVVPYGTCGTPLYYVVVGEIIKLLPIPTEGYVRALGDFYPSPLLDTTTSVDKMSSDLGDALAYLAAAEYFDMLDELQKGNFWRQKGNAMVTEYIRYTNRFNSDDINLMYRDPLGNLGDETPNFVSSGSNDSLVDGGGADQTYNTDYIYDGGGAGGD